MVSCWRQRWSSICCACRSLLPHLRRGVPRMAWPSHLAGGGGRGVAVAWKLVDAQATFGNRRGGLERICPRRRNLRSSLGSGLRLRLPGTVVVFPLFFPALPLLCHSFRDLSGSARRRLGMSAPTRRTSLRRTCLLRSSAFFCRSGPRDVSEAQAQLERQRICPGSPGAGWV